MPIGTKATAGLVIGLAQLNGDIASRALLYPESFVYVLGVEKPSDAALNIGALSFFGLGSDSVRVYLQGAPAVTGYRVTILYTA